MSLTVWNSFYRNRVNRLPSSLSTPRIFPLDSFEIPKDTVIHYLSSIPGDNGPSYNDPLLKGVSRQVMMYYPEDLVTKEGDPHKLQIQEGASIRAFHSKNPKIRRLFKLEAMSKDPEIPLIVNYSYLQYGYRYTGTPLKRNWIKDNNIINTMAYEMAEVHKTNPSRHQFLFLDMPKSIPPLTIFKGINQGEQARYTSMFNGISKMMLLFIYNLVGKANRNPFFKIKKALDSINIVLKENGYYTIINLGMIYNLVKNVENQGGITPKVLQIRILNLYLNILRLRNEDLDKLHEQGELADQESTEETKAKVIDKTLSEDDSDDLEDNGDNDSSNEIKSTEETVEDVNEQLDQEDKEKIDKSIAYDDKKDALVFNEDVLTEEEQKELGLLEESVNEKIAKIENAKDSNFDRITIDYQEADNIFAKAPSLQQAMNDKLDELLEEGEISPSDVKKYEKLAEKIKTIEISGTTLDRFSQTTPEEIKVNQEDIPIQNSKTIFDKNMLKSTLIDFDKKYVTKIMEKDMAAMATNLLRAGIAVTDYKVKTTSDSSGVYNNYEVHINPIKGKPSSIKFKLPKVDEEGNYISNGVKYTLRKQKTDVPIRKINSYRVALTSAYGKVFIFKSERKQFNYAKALVNFIRAASFNADNKIITETRTGDVYDPSLKLPLLYSSLAKEFRTFKVKNDYYFYLDYHKREKRLGFDTKIEGKDYVICGMTKDKNAIVMDYDNNLFEYKDNKYVPLDSFINIIGFNRDKLPHNVAIMQVLGREVPLGIVFGYKMGLFPLLKMLGAKYELVENGAEVDYNPATSIKVEFSNYTLYMEETDKVAALIINGFNYYQGIIKDYKVEYFNSPDVYFNLLEGKRVSGRYLKEVDLLFDLFIDPITLKILEEMKEPQTFTGLLRRSCELILTDDYPPEVSAKYQRIRGYERMPALVYASMVKAIRIHNNKGNKTNSSINMSNDEVKYNFLNDPSNVAVKGINPFQDIRKEESVTYTGIGGRSKETMVKRTRQFDENDIGVISEAGVDSGAVGVNIFTSANPQFTNVYGMAKPITKEEIRKGNVNVPAMTSSIFNLQPSLDKDDVKRMVFASIQSDANIFAKGYEVLPVRTGFEQVIPYRLSKEYASMAEEKGKVLKVTPTYIEVQYKGSKESTKIPIGRMYGSDGGLTVPHQVITSLKEGDTFNKGEALAYNPGFLEKDSLTGNLTLKMGILSNVAVIENQFTLEDGCAITKKLAEKLNTYTTHLRNIRVNFDQVLHEIKLPGTPVSSEDELVLIEDNTTAQSQLFDEKSIELLKELKSMSPKAKYDGVIDRVEVYYNGEKENMSDELNKLVTMSDKIMLNRTTVEGNPHTGKVGDNYLVEGNKVLPNTAVIRFYVTGETGTSSGDKVMYGAQLKSTIGNVYNESPTTEDGMEIDALFGARSINARIVNSPYIVGTTAMLLTEIGKQASQILDE